MRTNVRIETIVFIFLLVLTFSVSIIYKSHAAPVISATARLKLPAWPSTFAGKSLTRVKLSSREKYIMGRFPGKMARFTDGERQIIFRWVLSPSRKLHPAVDCFRGLGYKITDIKIMRDQKHRLWRQFNADKKNLGLTVNEQIIDKNGKVFTDTSSWYWNAKLNKSQGPWLSVTVARIR